MTSNELTQEQQQYLAGFTAGSGISRTLAQLPTFAGTLGLAPSAAPQAAERPARPEDIH